MIVQIKRIILVIWIIYLPGQLLFSQDHKTKNNYTGAWETPSSWDPAWATPQTNVINLDITINGYITANSSLTFSGSSSKLIIDDTLVILGNLTIADNNDVQVNNEGILIVRGDLTISEDSKIEAKNYIIVTGNIIKQGSTNEGEISSDDDPVRVFIGGTILPASINNDNPNFPALNCSSPPTTPYTHSGCSYGDMTDIISDPIYPFFQSTCITATLTSSDADNSFCAGTSVTFTASGGTSYNFRVNSTSVQDGGSTTYTTTTLADGDIVDVVVTGAGDCNGTSAGITNLVYDLPAPTISGPTSLCTGATGNVYSTESGMSGYIWTVSPGGTITDGGGADDNTVTVSWTTSGAKTVTVNYTNGNGCTATSPTIYNISVDPLPAPTISGPTSLFAGATGNVYSTESGMSSYLWTVFSPGGTITAGGGTDDNTVTVSWTTSGAKTATVNYTNGNGCTATSPTIYNISVDPLPAPTISGPTSLCTGATRNVYSTESGMRNYHWKVSPGGTITAGGGTDDNTVTVTWTTTGEKTVTVNYTNDNGNIATNPATFYITVDPLPTANAENNGPVCEGSELNLTGGAAGMMTYLWTGPKGFTSTVQNPLVTSNASLAMAGNYTLTVTNASGCSGTASTRVKVAELPITLASNNGPVCTGNNLGLTGGPAAMTTYSWTGPNGFTSFVQNPSVSDNAALEMAGVYTLRAINEAGCKSADTTEVTVNETPIAFAGPQQELTFAFETQMAAELTPPETGEWSLISGTGHISTIDSPTTMITDLSTGENLFLWEVQNGSCKAIDEVKIIVNDLFVPSVITPDGDGKNDFFKISENIGQVELIIVNRWGNEEYRNNYYINDWDGRNNSGAELPYDTYFYILIFENGGIKKGSVLIVR